VRFSEMGRMAKLEKRSSLEGRLQEQRVNKIKLEAYKLVLLSL
jgi:hypothetical protein